ncbi:MAG: cell wall-binding protein, partial [Clostridium butyricum]
TGWYSDYDASYFFNSDGRAQKGWLQSDGHWYYFDNDYKMQTGWQYINQKWYYFNEDTGVMASNVKVGDYFVTADGSLQ